MEKAAFKSQIFMRVISRGKLRDFWQQRAYRDSKLSLETWYDVTHAARWTTHDDVKRDFGARVDLAYGLYVFDIHGNSYRLVCRVDFFRHGVLTLWVGTHNEYELLCRNGGRGLKKL